MGRFFMSVLMSLLMALLALFLWGFIKALVVSHYHWMFPVP